MILTLEFRPNISQYDKRVHKGVANILVQICVMGLCKFIYRPIYKSVLTDTISRHTCQVLDRCTGSNFYNCLCVNHGDNAAYNMLYLCADRHYEVLPPRYIGVALHKLSCDTEGKHSQLCHPDYMIKSFESTVNSKKFQKPQKIYPKF